MGVTLFIGAFEALNGLMALSQTGVHDSKIGRSDVSPFRHSLKLR